MAHAAATSPKGYIWFDCEKGIPAECPDKPDDAADADTVPAFYKDIVQAHDCKLVFKRVIWPKEVNPLATHSSFVVWLCFKNNANVIFAIYQLSLKNILSFDDAMLLLRFFADLLKDLAVAKIKLPMGGAKEMIYKIIQGVFPTEFKTQTLDALLTILKGGWGFADPPDPAAGEVITQGISSSDDHKFKLPDELQVMKLIFRDSGPNATEVFDDFFNLHFEKSKNKRDEQDERLTKDMVLNALNGIAIADGVSDGKKLFIRGPESSLDPATNPNKGHLCLCDVDYEPDFLSKWNGVTPNKLYFNLSTTCIATDRFLCNVRILLTKTNIGSQFSKILCTMRSLPENGGFGSGGGSYRLGGPNDVPNDNFIKLFIKGIAGNATKNRDLLTLLNKVMTTTEHAEGLTSLTLKSWGDANQLLYIISHVLYLAFWLLKHELNHFNDTTPGAKYTGKSLHFFFMEILSKCAIITCDSVLARTAVALKIPVVYQTGSVVSCINFTQTDQYNMALCAFNSQRGNLLRKMDEAKSSLAKFGGFNSNLVDSDGIPSPILGNVDWFSFNAIRARIATAIDIHITETLNLKPPLPQIPPALDSFQPLIKSLEKIGALYKIPIVTHTRNRVHDGAERHYYNLDYLRALLLVLSVGDKPFTVRTQRCKTEPEAIAHIDYQQCLAAVNVLSPPPPPVSPHLQSVPLPLPATSATAGSMTQAFSPLHSERAVELPPTPTPPPTRPVTRSMAAAAKISNNNDTYKTKFLPKKQINQIIKTNTTKRAQIDSLSRERPDRSLSSVGGKPKKRGNQIGGANINRDDIFALLGSDYITENTGRLYVTLKIDGIPSLQKLISTAQPSYPNIHFLDVPFVHFWLLALLGSIENRRVVLRLLSYLGSDDFGVELQSIYDIVCEFISTLKKIYEDRTYNVNLSQFHAKMGGQRRETETADPTVEAAVEAAASVVTPAKPDDKGVGGEDATVEGVGPLTVAEATDNAMGGAEPEEGVEPNDELVAIITKVRELIALVAGTGIGPAEGMAAAVVYINAVNSLLSTLFARDDTFIKPLYQLLSLGPVSEEDITIQAFAAATSISLDRPVIVGEGTKSEFSVDPMHLLVSGSASSHRADGPANDGSPRYSLLAQSMSQDYVYTRPEDLLLSPETDESSQPSVSPPTSFETPEKLELGIDYSLVLEKLYGFIIRGQYLKYAIMAGEDEGRADMAVPDSQSLIAVLIFVKYYIEKTVLSGPVNISKFNKLCITLLEKINKSEAGILREMGGPAGSDEDKLEWDEYITYLKDIKEFVARIHRECEIAVNPGVNMSKISFTFIRPIFSEIKRGTKGQRASASPPPGQGRGLPLPLSPSRPPVKKKGSGSGRGSGDGNVGGSRNNTKRTKKYKRTPNKRNKTIRNKLNTKSSLRNTIKRRKTKRRKNSSRRRQ